MSKHDPATPEHPEVFFPITVQGSLTTERELTKAIRDGLLKKRDEERRRWEESGGC